MSNSKQHKTRYVKSESEKAAEEFIFEQKKKRYPSFPYPVKDKYSNTTNGLTKLVIDFIRANGYHAERVSNQGQYRDNSKIVTDVLGRKRKIGSGTWTKGQGINGTADIHCIIKSKPVMIEIKFGSDRQSKAQKEYQKFIESSGGIYLVVKTFEDFYNWFNSIDYERL